MPQQEAYVIERFGKFTKVLDPGFCLLVPFMDQIAYVHSLKEQTVDIPEQPAVTTDNVSIQVNGVLFATVISTFSLKSSDYYFSLELKLVMLETLKPFYRAM